jgi:hypothetical protein
LQRRARRLTEVILELAKGFEPPTSSLQVRCSTVELRQQLPNLPFVADLKMICKKTYKAPSARRITFSRRLKGYSPPVFIA